METVNNVASAASKLIWGEQAQQQTTATNETGGVEPISGEQGKGTVEEPFDKGNETTGNETTTSNETGGVEPISGEQGKGTVEEPFDKGNEG